MDNSDGKKISISEQIRVLYPGLCDAEYEEIEDTLRRYHAIALRIYERRRREAEDAENDSLTENGRRIK